MVKLQTKIKEFSNKIRDHNTDGLQLKVDQLKIQILKLTDRPIPRKLPKVLKAQLTKILWG